MSMVDVAASAALDTEFEFVLEQLAVILPQDGGETGEGCKGCNKCAPMAE